MKNMLTPRKGRSDGLQTPYGPAVVTGKALCNVSTTSQQNPDNVLNELTRALVAKGIPCQQKGKKESVVLHYLDVRPVCRFTCSAVMSWVFVPEYSSEPYDAFRI